MTTVNAISTVKSELRDMQSQDQRLQMKCETLNSEHQIKYRDYLNPRIQRVAFLRRRSIFAFWGEIFGSILIYFLGFRGILMVLGVWA